MRSELIMGCEFATLLTTPGLRSGLPFEGHIGRPNGFASAVPADFHASGATRKCCHPTGTRSFWTGDATCTSANCDGFGSRSNDTPASSHCYGGRW